MPKRRVIEGVEFGRMFGVDVIRGYVAGRPFIAPYHWTARNRIGLCVTGQLSSDEVLAIGSYRSGWEWPVEWAAEVDIRSRRANMAEAV